MADLGSFKFEEYTKKTATEKPITFKIIHVFNISKSIMNQLDDWRECVDPMNVSVDRIRRGNNGGNRLIREVRMEEDTYTENKVDTYKLLLRDSGDNYCYAYEYNDSLRFLRQENTGTPLGIRLGGKLLVKPGTKVTNGTLLLCEKQCQYMGVEEGDELAEKLNRGIVAKYIEVLEKELKAKS